MDTLATFLTRVARVYDVCVHTPEQPAVATAYAALMRALWLQFADIPYRVRFVVNNPYANAERMRACVKVSHTLFVYTGGELPPDHPLTTDIPALTGEQGQRVEYNHVFRAVHDGLVHIPHGLSFSARDEFRAFQEHAQLIYQTNEPQQRAAIHALATETLAQSAWFNYSDTNLSRIGTRTPRAYAPQKATLLPWSLIQEALTLEVD